MRCRCFWFFFSVSVIIVSGCKHHISTGVINSCGITDSVRLITLAPGHFHAALVQKVSYPSVAKEVSVYAPVGDEVELHLQKIEDYNRRKESPTSWRERVYRGGDFLQKMEADSTGNVVVIAGNNRDKTEFIKRALLSGKNVLADKPMAIDSQSFGLLKECFDIASKNGTLLYDIMTERFEITSILQREFSRYPGLFGVMELGSPDNPAIVKESVHHFFKEVSGKPLIRPAWFFDVDQEGDGIVDVGTHLVDLIQWACFPEVIIDYMRDVCIIDANRYTTRITPAQFELVTGLSEFPEYLQKDVCNGGLEVYANGDMLYSLKGVHARVSVKWDFAPPAGGGDTHYSIMRGTRANLIIKQGKEENFIPSLFIECREDRDRSEFRRVLSETVKEIRNCYEGIAFREVSDSCWEIIIPEVLRTGHEAHFGEVTQNYLQYLMDGELPSWEVPNMIAKYYTTTQAYEFALRKAKGRGESN